MEVKVYTKGVEVQLKDMVPGVTYMLYLDGQFVLEGEKRAINRKLGRGWRNNF
jgi:hypothetical protein